MPDPMDHADLLDEVIDLLVEVNLDMGRYFATCAAASGLGPMDAKALLAVTPGEPVAMRVIAGRIGVDRSNLTSVVDRLEGRDLVRRSASPQDGRIKAVELSEIGVARRDALQERLRTGPRPLDTLALDELEQLRVLLRRGINQSS